MFVVIALHDGSGHGQESALLLVTEVFSAALELAKHVEERTGFKFGKDTSVTIHQPTLGHVYSKDSEPRSAIYCRLRYIEWSERWLDDDFFRKHVR